MNKLKVEMSARGVTSNVVLIDGRGMIYLAIYSVKDCIVDWPL